MGTEARCALPPEKWIKGMQLIYRRGTVSGPVSIERIDPDGEVILLYNDGSRGKDHRDCLGDDFFPASYSDLGRQPLDGERAVKFQGPDQGIIFTCRPYKKTKQLAWLDDKYGEGYWIACAAAVRDFAPLADEPREEPADARLCREEAQARASEAPAPTGCARVAAVMKELEKDYDTDEYVLSDDYSLEELRAVIAIADKWRPRLHEFEPCGDCPNCLRSLAGREAFAQAVKRLLPDGCCEHGWRIGTACPDCPTGRAR